MVKFISDIIGSQVLLFQERAHIGPARDVIIDPTDGAFLGVIILDPIERKKKVVPTSEIKGTGKNFILIKDYESVTEPEDVVKINAALAVNPKILGARVETQSGQVLGKVEDATVDFKLMCLFKLYVRSGAIVKFFADDLIIPAKKIIEIQSDRIIVSDEYLTLKAGKPVVSAALSPE